MHKTLLGALLFTFSITGILAQSPATLNGQWEGAIALPGRTLNMQISVTGAAGDLTITLDVPQQQMRKMETTAVEFLPKEDPATLSFKVPDIPGNAGWQGIIKLAREENARDSLIGQWSQGKQKMQLNFARPSGPLFEPALSANLERIEAYATELLGRMNVPGAGIAIINGDKIIQSFGVGFADLKAKRPATGATVFAIGSSSKAFTSFGLGQLVDEGKLEWEKPVRNYLSDFKMYDDFATEEMTAVDLLTHRSGLPRHDLLWYLNGELTRDDLYQRLQYLEPTKSFRSAWQYQNLMYMTAGILTERISGKSWEDYTRDNIFEPLGMSSANFDVNSLPGLPDFAYGYEENEEKDLEIMDFHPLPAIGPAGSINASAADMAKWVSVHLNGGKYGDKQIISESSLAALHRSRVFIGSNGISGGVSHTGYALGWFTYDWNGKNIIEHGGNIDGFSALVYMAPQEDIGFVILTNKNGTEYGSYLARYALDALTGEDDTDYYSGDDKPEEDEEEVDKDKKDKKKKKDKDKDDDKSPFPDTEPQHQNSDYAGTYLDPGYGEVLITEQDGKLDFRYGDLNTTLKHHHFETFRAEIEDIGQEIELNFIVGANGKIRSVEIEAEPSLGHPIVYEKQAEANMKTVDYLDQLAGKYLLDGQQLTIKRVGDHLTLDVPGQPTYELEADSDNTFNLVIISGYSVEFHFEKEQVVALELHQPNGDFRAERE